MYYKPNSLYSWILLLCLCVCMVQQSQSKYKFYKTLVFPQYVISTFALAPQAVKNSNNQVMDIVMCLQNDTLIFTNINTKEVVDKINGRNRQLSNVKYLEWTPVGVLIVSDYKSIIYDPVKREQVIAYYPDSISKLVNVKIGYRRQQNAIYAAIQQSYSTEILIYKNKTLHSKLFKKSSYIMAPIQFEQTGRYLYYLDNDAKKKYEYDVMEKEAYSVNSFSGNHMYMILTNKYLYGQHNDEHILVTKTSSGLVVIWDDPKNTNYIINQLLNISYIVFTYDREYLALVCNEKNERNMYSVIFRKIDYENYTNWNRQIIIEVEDYIRVIDSSQNYVACLRSNNDKIANSIQVFVRQDEQSNFGNFLPYSILISLVLLTAVFFLACCRIVKKFKSYMLREKMMQLVNSNPYEKYMNEQVEKKDKAGLAQIEMTSHQDKRNYQSDQLQQTEQKKKSAIKSKMKQQYSKISNAAPHQYESNINDQAVSKIGSYLSSNLSSSNSNNSNILAGINIQKSKQKLKQNDKRDQQGDEIKASFQSNANDKSVVEEQGDSVVEEDDQVEQNDQKSEKEHYPPLNN